VAAMNADPEVYRFTGGAKTREQTLLRITEAIDHQQQHGFSLWTVVLKSTGAVIGRCGLIRREIAGARDMELGYAFSREHWGFGYATEATRAALDYAVRVRACKRVVAIIDPQNRGSLAVAAKLGMSFEREVEFEGAKLGLYATSRM